MHHLNRHGLGVRCPQGRPAFTLLATFTVVAFALLSPAGHPLWAAVDRDAAVATFEEAKAISDRDAGKFWGRTLYGPMLLVEPSNSSVMANQADSAGILKAAGPIFTGTLPESVIIADTPTEWEGTRWTQLTWPLTTDPEKLHVTLAHELFHRIQPELKLSRDEVSNKHLDTLDGRYLMQLEWRALARALPAPNPADRRTAIADALLFRNQRYRLFAQAAKDESALTINEGVPEYTGVKLGLVTPEAQIRYAIRDLSAFVDAPTFVRSFAYALGPAYGLLLDDADPAWRGKLNSGKSLDELLSAALQLPASDFAALKQRENEYDSDGALRAHEEKRDKDKRAYLADLKSLLVDGPVLNLPLVHSNYRFNPQALQPLDTFGTVYPTMRLTDDWGTLEVESGGALLNDETKLTAVSAVGFDPKALKGSGWSLTVTVGWKIQPGKRQGDWIVTKDRESHDE